MYGSTYMYGYYNEIQHLVSIYGLGDKFTIIFDRTNSGAWFFETMRR